MTTQIQVYSSKQIPFDTGIFTFSQLLFRNPLKLIFQIKNMELNEEFLDDLSDDSETNEKGKFHFQYTHKKKY